MKSFRLGRIKGRRDPGDAAECVSDNQAPGSAVGGRAFHEAASMTKSRCKDRSRSLESHPAPGRVSNVADEICARPIPGSISLIKRSLVVAFTRTHSRSLPIVGAVFVRGSTLYILTNIHSCQPSYSTYILFVAIHHVKYPTVGSFWK